MKDDIDEFLLEGKTSERYFNLQKALFEFSNLFAFDEPNDRAIAVIGGAFLDTLLIETLYNFFPENEKEVNELLDHNNPLGSYSARVKMVYCLGLIDKLIMNDLKLVGKIRNKFAHDLNASFRDENISSWCKGLKWHRFFYMTPPIDATNRDLFQVGVHQLIFHLYGIVSIAAMKKIKIQDAFFKEYQIRSE